MNLLLDTHAFLWWVMDDDRLPPGTRTILADPDNHLFLSAVTGWEMAIKSRLGKLKLPQGVERFVPHQIKVNGMEVLPIQMSHALQVASLPDHHHDPFDRLLIAQAQVENMPLVTADSEIEKYHVRIVWK